MIVRVLRHIAAFRRSPGQRLLDTCYGPQSLPLRTQCLALLFDRKFTGSSKEAQWGNFRATLLTAAGINLKADCLAGQDASFESIARKLLEGPADSNPSPLNGDSAMAKKNEVPVAKVAPAGGTPSSARPKTVCPLSEAEFLAKAPPIEVLIDGNKFIAGGRKFSTGSVGYNVSAKFTKIIDGKAVDFQVGLNVTAVGSKPAK